MEFKRCEIQLMSQIFEAQFSRALTLIALNASAAEASHEQSRENSSPLHEILTMNDIFTSLKERKRIKY